MEKKVNKDYKKSICILIMGIIAFLLKYSIFDYKLANRINIIAIVATTYGLTSLILHKFFLSTVIKRLKRENNEDYILTKYKASNVTFWVTFWSNIIFYIFSDLLVISIRQLAMYTSLTMIAVYIISLLVYYKKG